MTQKILFLHIGRHKTGTSSIQQFVNSSPDLLSQLNLYYPESGKSGIAHHDLAKLFSMPTNKTTEAQQNSLNSPVLKSLINEIDQQSANVLLSSESFQNSHPLMIKEAFKKYDLRVIVYIRNQIDYLASSYAQKVWATNYCQSMEHYYEHVFSSDYLGFLTDWKNASDGHIKVRKFTRNSLCDKDIVADFFVNMLGVDNLEIRQKILRRGVADANPSLTAELLAYKLKYNSSNIDCADSTQRLIRQALANLSLKKEGDPVRVTAQLKETCIQACAQTNKQVSEQFFDGQELFSMDRPTGIPAELGDTQFQAISEKLINNDPRVSAPILKFSELLQPTLKAG